MPRFRHIKPGVSRSPPGDFPVSPGARGRPQRPQPLCVGSTGPWLLRATPWTAVGDNALCILPARATATVPRAMICVKKLCRLRLDSEELELSLFSSAYLLKATAQHKGRPGGGGGAVGGGFWQKDPALVPGDMNPEVVTRSELMEETLLFLLSKKKSSHRSRCHEPEQNQRRDEITKRFSGTFPFSLRLSGERREVQGSGAESWRTSWQGESKFWILLPVSISNKL